MRRISLLTVGMLLFTVLTALAQEEATNQEEQLARFRITGEVGYVFLTDHEDEILEDAVGYGLTAGYRLSPSLEVRLPFFYSHHKAKEDLADNEDAEISLFSITPGLAFSTPGKLSVWFFIGAGVNFMEEKYKLGNLSSDERNLAGASCTAGGLDLNLFRNFSIGVSGSVRTASREVTQYDGSENWETFVYYTAVGRLTYAF